MVCTVLEKSLLQVLVGSFLFLVAFFYQRNACRNRSLQQHTGFDETLAGKSLPCYRMQFLVRCRGSSITAGDSRSWLAERSWAGVQWKVAWVTKTIVSAETPHGVMASVRTIRHPDLNLHPCLQLPRFPPSSFKRIAYEKGACRSSPIPAIENTTHRSPVTPILLLSGGNQLKSLQSSTFLSCDLQLCLQRFSGFSWFLRTWAEK